MTVRWKPLIVLSGLFLVIAVVGVLVATLDVVPDQADEIVATARVEREAKRYSNAQIHYMRALQVTPRDAKLHAELAAMYAEWEPQETDPARRIQHRIEYLSALADAAKYGKDSEPRRLLLADALAHEDRIQAVLWAKKLLDLDAQDSDAHFALAVDAVEAATPDAALLAKHLEPLAARHPDQARTAYLTAELARLRQDEAALAQALARLDGPAALEVIDSADRMALLRLRQLAALHTTDPARLDTLCATLEAEARELVAAGDTPPARRVKIGQLLAAALTHLDTIQAHLKGPETETMGLRAQSLGQTADDAFQSALAITGSTDLGVTLDYARHLLERQQSEACLERIDQALALPQAGLPAWADTVAQMREVAIKAALLQGEPDRRFARAETYIQALLKAVEPTQQAIGHLFQGVIDLERSGVAETLSTGAATVDTTDPKLRSSALEHLKQAATGLPEVATAQALYGVALLLCDEVSLGRQYLALAQRLPGIEPRYQLWAAWATIQAGYPEDAEPIVASLREQLEAGTLDPSLVQSVLLVTGEVMQARRTPEDLKRAQAAFQQALDGQQGDGVALELRLAEIDVQMGRADLALQRVQRLRENGQGGAAADQMAVLILSEQGRVDLARQVLQAARSRHATSSELACVDAALWLKQEQPEQAEAALGQFIEANPQALDAIQLRARVLAEYLDRGEDARQLLSAASQWADSTAPLVQLALLDLGNGDSEAVRDTIHRIRDRWPAAAAADLLEAQLALASNDMEAARTALAHALERDPGNKVALFWKAQLDSRGGDPDRAARIYESIAQGNPSKELEDGLTLATAANWALASLALENRELDTAITRLESLLKGPIDNAINRPVRWQLAIARASKGEWAQARLDIEALLADPATTTEERVRAANLYRLNGEAQRATAILDAVLAQQPAETTAIAMRAFLAAEQDPSAGTALIQQAIAAAEQPPSLYLMWAALENLIPPADTGLTRALAAIDKGIEQHPQAYELIEGRFRVLRLANREDEGVAFLQAHAPTDPDGRVRTLLAEVHLAANRPQEAAAIARTLRAEHPDDPTFARLEVRIAATLALASQSEGGSAQAIENAFALIQQARAQFPDNPDFLQAQADLAVRTGQAELAGSLSRELDTLAPRSPAGPLVRAQLAASRGWTEGALDAYNEAVQRAPRRADLRLALGELSLASGKTDQAIEQASWIMQSEPESASGLVLKVRALIQDAGAADQNTARRAEAARLLTDALARNHQFLAGYHLLAEIKALDGDRAGSLALLERGLGVDPRDAAGLSQMIQLLCQPPTPDGMPVEADVQRAEALARRLATPDSTGQLPLAASIAFHRAGLYTLALPWARTAVEKLGSWVAHLNYGDLLLAEAESSAASVESRALFEQALAAYDQVLERQINSIEAVNNKAWILHQYLGRHAEALALAQATLDRNDPATLPAEFFDTLGSIQEAMNRPRDAEASYRQGLRLEEEHPILNLHMARLLAADPARAEVARVHLRTAQDGRDQLPPSMDAELDTLARQLAP